MSGSDFDTVARTKFYVSTSAPTAQTAAAFEGLTWVEVGSLTSIGSVKGREYSTATASTVGDGQEREKKGTFKLPNAEFECLWAESDAGQIIIEAASKDDSIPSFKLEKQNGDLRYFTAQVAKFSEMGGTSNDAVKGAFTLLRQTDTISA